MSNIEGEGELTGLAKHQLVILLCRHSFTGKCDYPTPEDDAVSISSHGDSLIEGTTVNFSCPSGLTVIGPNTSMCMNNGRWEPDPSGIKCLGNFTM